MTERVPTFAEFEAWLRRQKAAAWEARLGELDQVAAGRLTDYQRSLPPSQRLSPAEAAECAADLRRRIAELDQPCPLLPAVYEAHLHTGALMRMNIPPLA